MKKIIAILLALVLVLSLSAHASAITPGIWGETNYGYTQPVEPTEPPTEAPEELPENPGECCWRWQNSVVLRDLILSYL